LSVIAWLQQVENVHPQRTGVHGAAAIVEEVIATSRTSLASFRMGTVGVGFFQRAKKSESSL
jgi:hypothetical protein